MDGPANFGEHGKCFSFAALGVLGAAKYCKIMKEDLLLSGLLLYHSFRFYGRRKYLEKIHQKLSKNDDLSFEYKPQSYSNMLNISPCFQYYGFKSQSFALAAPKSMNKLRLALLDYHAPLYKCYMPKVVSRPISLSCNAHRFMV